MSESFDVAVVGVGYWGLNYLRVMTELPEVGRIVACDTRPESLREATSRFPKVEVATSLDELGEVDAAIVCTPARTHHAVASELLERGLHLLVEKPFTETSEQALQLIELADEHRSTVAVGHTFLHNSAVKLLDELHRTDRLGRLYYMYARRTNLGPIRTDVNALWDLAPHDISVFNHLLGSGPTTVSAVGHRALRSNREDVGFVSLTYPKNIVAHIHVSWADPSKVREMVLVGEKSRVVFNDLNPVESIRIFEKGVAPVPVDGGSFAEHTLQITDGDIISPRIQWREPLKDQVIDFLEAIDEGRQPTSPPNAGLDVVRVMEAIDRSVAASGAPTLVEKDGVEVEDGRTFVDHTETDARRASGSTVIPS